MHNRQLLLIILIILPFISLVLAAKITTSKPTASTKSNVTTKATAKATTKARSGTRKVITTRLGANGNPEEQCECTLFYLCDKDNVITLTNGNECDSSSVCCSIPIGTLGPGTDSIFGSDSSSASPTTPSIENTSFILYESSSSPLQTSPAPPSCICVPFYQCPTYDQLVATAGAGIINPRIPCDAPEVCCPADQIITDGTPTPQTPTAPDTPFPTPTPSPTPAPNPEECGIRRGGAIGTRIVSPETLMQTSFGEFPWMALVLTTEILPNGTRTENVFVCGASILSPFIVLTAAHCVNDANISLLKVRVGEYNTHVGSTEPAPHQDRLVSAIHMHPNFNSKVLFNDLALLSVSDAFELAPHVSPICAPFMGTSFAEPNVYNPNQCVATGWGKNAFAEGNFQTTLRKVDLTVIPRDQCQAQLRQTRLGQLFNLDPSFVCAGGQPGFDTCQGDGGGPLICALRNNPSRYVQVGVVSWGIGCANNVPGVYASLEANREWLTTEFNTLTVFRRG